MKNPESQPGRPDQPKQGFRERWETFKATSRFTFRGRYARRAQEIAQEEWLDKGMIDPRDPGIQLFTHDIHQRPSKHPNTYSEGRDEKSFTQHRDEITLQLFRERYHRDPSHTSDGIHEVNEYSDFRYGVVSHIEAVQFLFEEEHTTLVNRYSQYHPPFEANSRAQEEVLKRVSIITGEKIHSNGNLGPIFYRVGMTDPEGLRERMDTFFGDFERGKYAEAFDSVQAARIMREATVGQDLEREAIREYIDKTKGLRANAQELEMYAQPVKENIAAAQSRWQLEIDAFTTDALAGKEDPTAEEIVEARATATQKVVDQVSEILGYKVTDPSLLGVEYYIADLRDPLTIDQRTAEVTGFDPMGVWITHEAPKTPPPSMPPLDSDDSPLDSLGGEVDWSGEEDGPEDGPRKSL